MHNLLENFFNILDKYHQSKIINYLKLLKLEKIIDVGAHKGEFLSYVLKLDGIKKIFVFEPQTEINKFLVQKFGNIKNIKIFKYALDEEISNKEIYINKLTSTSTLSEFNSNSFFLKFKNFLTGSKNNFINKYNVDTNSIDNLFKDIVLNNTLLKIDVEGFEIKILKGGIKKISLEIPYILIENHFANQYKNSNSKLVHNYLIGKNFKVLSNFYFPTLHFKDVLYKKNNDQN